MAKADTDIDRLITILRCTPALPKPDFDRLAKEVGLKDAKEATMKKLGLLKNQVENPSEAKATPATPPRKRGKATVEGGGGRKKRKLTPQEESD
ncbi:hypothetical protein H2198_009210 [Neophaeococcomyces mojaviensis]|uniref:Uncharacterized protein n=1 Tax=Neophaeococcomyces mojaviensis TaxID=3383035 RepID=A0ACC2ZVC6_9EURO|nr:hypothetical protein H2198_009210 [Knufia sp. JES_112]